MFGFAKETEKKLKTIIPHKAATIPIRDELKKLMPATSRKKTIRGGR